MKPFSFRLQNLLHLREALEKVQGANLGDAERTEGALRVTAEQSGTRLAAAEDQAVAPADTPREAGLWHAVGLSIEAARASAEQAAEELRQAEAQRAVELERFNEARAARRVLEKLRERREADHDVEAGREERREFEDQVISRLPNGGARS